jgi:transposase
LARHVREHAAEAGYPSLSKAAKATVHRILAAQPLHPEKVKYYLERRDPDFEARMREVLLVYQDVELQNQNVGRTPAVITVSVDEKPGLQAIANTTPDLPPVPGRHASIARDHEYKRLGTCSILAALDLHTGHVTGRVERRHRSREFIALLKDLDNYYPADCNIRLILDNHSAHISKETQTWLATRPNRFKYVLTPKHGSWLNYRGNPVRQDEPHLSAKHPRTVLGRTPRPDSEGYRRDQRRACSSSVEEIRSPGSGLICICFNETIY